MMDWYTIEFLYPNGFKRFTEIMFPNLGVLSLNTLEFYDTKKLYQFFDKEGVYLMVEIYNPKHWGYNISLSNGAVINSSSNGSKNTREEIEVDGFLECFKILEKKMMTI
jgi:hypothetical protein